MLSVRKFCPFQNKTVVLGLLSATSLIAMVHQFGGASSFPNDATSNIIFSPCEYQFQNSSSTNTSSILTSLPMRYENLTKTIYVCGGTVDLSRISSVIGNDHVLNLTSKKNWFLNADITLMRGATFFINSTDTDWLKINSTAGTAYSIVARGKSNLVIDHSKITSWNSTSNTEATLGSGKEPRAFLLNRWDGGQMNITNSNLSSLGYIVRDRYGAIMGNTSGVAYFAGHGSIIKNNTISNNFRGFYSSNVSEVTIENNSIHDNYEYGLDPHTGSRNLKIIGNNIYNNGHHGIICSKSCRNVIVERNVSYNNSGHGIMLDQLVTNSTVNNNKVYNNRFSGIAIWNSTNDIIEHNIIYDNNYGLIITGNSHHNRIKDNIIRNSLLNGIYLYNGSTNNILERNTILNSSDSGMYIKDSDTQANKFMNNNIMAASSYGLKFLNASNNRLINNSLYDNKPYDYYSKFYSNNTIIDTIFNNTTLRFFDNSSNIILENTNNKIVGNNRKAPNIVYPTYSSLLISPTRKNVITNTLDMVVIPSSKYVIISAISRNHDSHNNYISWLQISPETKIRTKYFIGDLVPNTPLIIQTNGSLLAVRTANSSGFISFIYEGKDSVIEFKVVPAFLALIQVWILVLVIVSLVLFIVVKNYRRRKKDKILHHSI